MKSVIKLFKGILLEKDDLINFEPDAAITKRTIANGYIFAPNILLTHTNKDLTKLMYLVEEQLCLSGVQLNSTFHKSWKKIREASLDQLIEEQILHYMSTYGAEAFGTYDAEFVYVPSERLDIPGTNVDRISFILIRGFTKDQLKEKLLNLLQSGIALKADTIADVLDVAALVSLNSEEVDSIRNKEVKIALFDSLNLVPENPVEFLRYVIYKSTGKTLLIKNRETIAELKSARPIVPKLFDLYEQSFGLERLAQVFYRFKPLFLALRITAPMKVKINKLRRLAKTNHKPMVQDFLNTITAKVKREENFDSEVFQNVLSRTNVFRKARLAYALYYRTKDVDSIMYRIRNGKAYAKDFTFEPKWAAEKALTFVLDSIAADMAKNVQGKRIYIPGNIEYALPTTEKQFVGAFPAGTCIQIPKDLVLGVYWEDVDSSRIDLDLSLADARMKFGWDARWRNTERSVLFSGDMTEAPNGASEVFYVAKQTQASYLVNLNYFNYMPTIPVPFKFFVGAEHVTNMRGNYTVDPNNIIAITSSKMTKKQAVLGLVDVDEQGSRFYFMEAAIGNSITHGITKHSQQSLAFMLNFYKDSIKLSDLLVSAGGVLTDNKEECDIDLSPEKLEINTILNLLKGN